LRLDLLEVRNQVVRRRNVSVERIFRAGVEPTKEALEAASVDLVLCGLQVELMDVGVAQLRVGIRPSNLLEVVDRALHRILYGDPRLLDRARVVDDLLSALVERIGRRLHCKRRRRFLVALIGKRLDLVVDREREEVILVVEIDDCLDRIVAELIEVVDRLLDRLPGQHRQRNGTFGGLRQRVSGELAGACEASERVFCLPIFASGLANGCGLRE
jgi:hypothetical protein